MIVNNNMMICSLLAILLLPAVKAQFCPSRGRSSVSGCKHLMQKVMNFPGGPPQCECFNFCNGRFVDCKMDKFPEECVDGEAGSQIGCMISDSGWIPISSPVPPPSVVPPTAGASVVVPIPNPALCVSCPANSVPSVPSVGCPLSMQDCFCLFGYVRFMDSFGNLYCFPPPSGVPPTAGAAPIAPPPAPVGMPQLPTPQVAPTLPTAGASTPSIGKGMSGKGMSMSSSGSLPTASGSLGGDGGKGGKGMSMSSSAGTFVESQSKEESAATSQYYPQTAAVAVAALYLL